MISLSDLPPQRTIALSERYECPYHGCFLVLVKHKLSSYGRKHSGIGVVTFFRCPHIYHVKVKKGTRPVQCSFMKPNKYQKRQNGERHK